MFLRIRSNLSFLDRLAWALLSSLFALAISTIVWAVVAFATSNPDGHTAAFVFAASIFAIAGFVSGPSFADVLGILFQTIWLSVSAWAVHLDAENDLPDKPFQPVWALLFYVAVVAGTVWLSLP